MTVMLAASIVTDLRTGKIYNLLTVPCVLAGMVLGTIAGGLTGVADRPFGIAALLSCL